MKISGIIWLEDIVQKLAKKHGLTRDEVKQVFANRPRFRFIEQGHRENENVYAASGKTDAGR